MTKFEWKIHLSTTLFLWISVAIFAIKKTQETPTNVNEWILLVINIPHFYNISENPSRWCLFLSKLLWLCFCGWKFEIFHETSERRFSFSPLQFSPFARQQPCNIHSIHWPLLFGVVLASTTMMISFFLAIVLSHFRLGIHLSRSILCRCWAKQDIIQFPATR